MVMELLGLFWTEKIKLSQYIIQTVKDLSDVQLDHPDSLGETVRRYLNSMVASDFLFRLSLPVSVGISSVLPLSRQSEADIEKDLVKVRDLFGSPALPVGLKEIIVTSAEELYYDTCNPSLKPVLDRWIKILRRIEKTIQNVSKKDSLKYRYFSVLGVISLPVAINYFGTQNLFYFRNGILKIKENPSFPKS
ncbi:hypothetical protein CH373_13335 [Leptospira perolatii]|uniref:Uncharacterized protein n=1 Tax=Leptospira perolatii TaxID=2023191 RepID=A0A2M9ZL28_9LEPT|nr:hypothetical protein [Leptospira perolatii]PJZ69908.1 hypothetical protein CH360_08350 [Leptospira perolatii]PJZ72684.1 hypothetical protein CH373_13335 [Leptospira perolatii]